MVSIWLYTSCFSRNRMASIFREISVFQEVQETVVWQEIEEIDIVEIAELARCRYSRRSGPATMRGWRSCSSGASSGCSLSSCGRPICSMSRWPLCDNQSLLKYRSWPTNLCCDLTALHQVYLSDTRILTVALKQSGFGWHTRIRCPINDQSPNIKI